MQMWCRAARESSGTFRTERGRESLARGGHIRLRCLWHHAATEERSAKGALMANEVPDTNSSPYLAVTLLMVTFPDGYRINGSGAVVGQNDVLTATHMIYSPDHGGFADR